MTLCWIDILLKLLTQVAPSSPALPASTTAVGGTVKALSTMVSLLPNLAGESKALRQKTWTSYFLAFPVTYSYLELVFSS